MFRSHLIIGIFCEPALACRSLADTEEHFFNEDHKTNLELSVFLSKVRSNLILSHADFVLLSYCRFHYIFKPFIKSNKCDIYRLGMPIFKLNHKIR